MQVRVGFITMLIIGVEISRTMNIQKKTNVMFIKNTFTNTSDISGLSSSMKKKIDAHYRPMKNQMIGSKKVEQAIVQVDDGRTAQLLHHDNTLHHTYINNREEKRNSYEEDAKEILGKVASHENNYNIYLENNKMDEYISDVNVTKEEMKMLYEDMHLGRMFENLVAKLYYNKKINGFVHLYNGQEAISTGIIKNLRPSDFVTSTYRDHVHAISKNVAPKKVLNELYGNYYGSTNRGKGGSMHIYSKDHNFIGGFGFIGEQIPIAVGLAYSILYKQEFPPQGAYSNGAYSNGAYSNGAYSNGAYSNGANSNGADSGGANSNGADSGGANSNGADGASASVTKKSTDVDVVVCFLGDGTTNIGQFFESLNLASVYNLPIIFVIENNNWAIGMEGSRSSTDDIMNNYVKGKSFNLDTYRIDGNDVLRIYKLMKKKVKEMRKRECGPVLIEAITYRAKGHSLADPDELRVQEEKSSWKKRDPLVHLASYMKKNNLVKESFFEEIKIKTKEMLKNAELDADENLKNSQNINVCHLLKQNIFAPSEKTSCMPEYKQYTKFDHLTDSELAEYYEALQKEKIRKMQNKKADPSEFFTRKALPLVIN
ncbi:pyruvate dehydrogenase E1 component subunit alpha [Plasmodium gonderi]|uniref:Pyruvate dehydrogenase E1 component subunit alpha n=1 Tax=Plasmodium gonderi TaxID=77519 RepID=A0A1Y1JKR5_PLAGO|nr:pyruvate dehydrogenase E1 component subunit alpha [Plasmodium gonderi]GAW81013.1 pyruvate dehydrogenase E1 component subunit alpha [Plasmodium gonderi]